MEKLDIVQGGLVYYMIAGGNVSHKKQRKDHAEDIACTVAGCVVEITSDKLYTGEAS